MKRRAENVREPDSYCVFLEPGTEVTVVWGDLGEPQKEIRATVAPAPYTQDNRLLDVSKC